MGLDVSSVDHRFRGVRVMGKGRKERILPVGAPAPVSYTHLCLRQPGHRDRERDGMAFADLVLILVDLTGPLA